MFDLFNNRKVRQLRGEVEMLKLELEFAARPDPIAEAFDKSMKRACANPNTLQLVGMWGPSSQTIYLMAKGGEDG